MYEFFYNHGVFLLLVLFILWVVGLCACYAVGTNIRIEAGLLCKPRRLFYNCLKWPWFLALMFMHRMWR